jgi:hypothetical protein
MSIPIATSGGSDELSTPVVLLQDATVDAGSVILHLICKKVHNFQLKQLAAQLSFMYFNTN